MSASGTYRPPKTPKYGPGWVASNGLCSGSPGTCDSSGTRKTSNGSRGLREWLRGRRPGQCRTARSEGCAPAATRSATESRGASSVTSASPTSTTSAPERA